MLLTIPQLELSPGRIICLHIPPDFTKSFLLLSKRFCGRLGAKINQPRFVARPVIAEGVASIFDGNGRRNGCHKPPGSWSKKRQN